MQNNRKNWTTPDSHQQEENHRVGKELYRRDERRNQPSADQSASSRWDLDNHFHTGPNQQSRSHFPEDTHQRTSNADWGGARDKHYGQREHSVYRNNNSLDYGDGRGHSSRQNTQQHQGWPSAGQQGQSYSAYGDGRGNYSARQDSYGRGQDYVHGENVSAQRRRDDSNENYYRGAYMDERGVKRERPHPDDNPYTEYPGTRSRYKDDDYRYGSGNHSWPEERRYTDNSGRRQDRDKGDILDDMGAGLRDAWHDVKHGVQNTFNRFSSDDREDRQYTTRNAGNRNDHEYRSRRDQGTERGPRWSDETDSGDDSFFYKDDRNPRYY